MVYYEEISFQVHQDCEDAHKAKELIPVALHLDPYRQNGRGLPVRRLWDRRRGFLSNHAKDCLRSRI